MNTVVRIKMNLFLRFKNVDEYQYVKLHYFKVSKCKRILVRVNCIFNETLIRNELGYISMFIELFEEKCYNILFSLWTFHRLINCVYIKRSVQVPVQSGFFFTKK